MHWTSKKFEIFQTSLVDEYLFHFIWDCVRLGETTLLHLPLEELTQIRLRHRPF